MRRLNFTLDDSDVELLEELASGYYSGNKSQLVRSALESLATHLRHAGWVISGYTQVPIESDTECHSCHALHRRGEMLFRPVFERGTGIRAVEKLPSEIWLDCPECAAGGQPDTGGTE